MFRRIWQVLCPWDICRERRGRASDWKIEPPILEHTKMAKEYRVTAPDGEQAAVPLTDIIDALTRDDEFAHTPIKRADAAKKATLRLGAERMKRKPPRDL